MDKGDNIDEDDLESLMIPKGGRDDYEVIVRRKTLLGDLRELIIIAIATGLGTFLGAVLCSLFLLK